MNGVHDMGGMHGMGPIQAERDEPVFHSEWERRAFAINVASGFLGKWNIDMSRYAREQMPPAEYLGTSYYEHWLWGLEKLLVDKGILTREEVAARLTGRPAPLAPPPSGLRVLKALDVAKALQNRRAARMDDPVPPRFKPGDHVVTKNMNPVGHTRLPRYARGRRGLVDRDHGVFVFPDAAAAERGRQPQHVYSVRFAGRELWGPEAPERDAIYIDLFEPYLEPA
ncbi:MAG TPA: nitrile hydratase subunit beta [Methylomirabilota bacterium]|nr:nitrile hydratase subunit beta [Methylomirabilota bacterium]